MGLVELAAATEAGLILCVWIIAINLIVAIWSHYKRKK